MTAVTADQAHKMKVDELKAELRKLGLDQKGKKQELLDRLLAAISKAEPVNTPVLEVKKGEEDTPIKVTRETITNVTQSVACAVTAEVVVPDIVLVAQVPVHEDTKQSQEMSHGSAMDNAHLAEDEKILGNETSKPSPTQPTVYTATESPLLEDENVGSAADLSSTPHIRVDNFLRPFTNRALLEWLTNTLAIPIAEADFWLNPIKTHCYISFSSRAEAARCKVVLSGNRFQSSSPLVASFTTVSASEAGTSAEAALKPGQWQTGSITTTGTAGIKGAPILSRTNSAEVGSLVGLKPLTPLGGRSLPSSDLFKQAIKNVSERRSSREVTVLAGETGSIRGDSTNGFVTSRSREEPRGDVPSKRQREDEDYRGDAKKMKEAEVTGLSLDELFRKTSCFPHLYWLPVPSDVVERRRASLKR